MRGDGNELRVATVRIAPEVELGSRRPGQVAGKVVEVIHEHGLATRRPVGQREPMGMQRDGVEAQPCEQDRESADQDDTASAMAA
jgi:hypothetical protein